MRIGYSELEVSATDAGAPSYVSPESAPDPTLSASELQRLASVRHGPDRQHAFYFGSLGTSLTSAGSSQDSEQGATALEWWETRPTFPDVTIPPSSERIELPGDYVMAPGDVLHFAKYMGWPYGWLTILRDMDNPNPEVTTSGMIFASSNGPWGSAAIGTLGGLPYHDDTGHITWRNTGQIYANAWLEGGNVLNLTNNHSKLTYFGASTTFINSGLLQAAADWGGGFLMLGERSTLINEATGVIRVWSDSYTGGLDHHALGGYIDGGPLTNAGLIEVSSRNQDGAMGVWGSSLLTNSGTIRVHADESTYSIGLYECLKVTNSGRLEAAVAVWLTQSLTNTGEILGDLVEVSETVNTGIIEGDIYFGDLQSSYDGRGGQLWGSIYLGAAQNTVFLGDNGGAIFGGLTGTNALTGGAGDDIFDLIGGANTIVGADGFDLISYLGHGSAVTASLVTGTGRGGVDQFSGIEGLIGSAFNDTLTGASGSNRLNGAVGDDQLVGGGADDRLVGGGGDDVLTGAGGADTLIGGAGVDSATFSGPRSEYVIATSGGVTTVQRGDTTTTLTGVEKLVFNDQTVTIAAAAAISGSAAGDTLTGGAGDDRLLGQAGDDILDGGQGSDTLEGGDGMDTAVFHGNRAQYVIDLESGTVSDLENSTQLISIERIRFNDQTLIVRPGAGLYISGGMSAETLTGTASGDEIEAGGGADLVSGLAGDDLLWGEDGDDRLTGGEGIDQLHGGGGDDLLTGEGGDILSGDEGNDHLLVIGVRHQTAGIQLIGGPGNDTAILRAGDAAADLAAGTASAGATQISLVGIENIQVEGATDQLYPAIRSVYGDSGANHISVGGLGDNGSFQVTFDGRDGDDYLRGGFGADTLTGGLGRDVLDGAGGADILRGDTGDRIWGGDGDDTLDVQASSTTAETFLAGGAGIDIVTLKGATVSLDLAAGGGRLQSSDLTITEIETILVDVNSTDRQSLSGDAGVNRIGIAAGSSASAHMRGLGGDDVLFSGVSSDILDGGSGLDTADFSLHRSGGALTIRLDLGTASRAGGIIDTLISIENAVGTPYADTIFGNAGANVLSGGSGSDILLGLGGNDVLRGGDFYANTMYGGQGDDLYIVDHEGDSLIEAANEGIDTVETDQMFRLGANIENLTYTGFSNFRGDGNELDNVIRGGSQRDSLYGNGGNDTLIGGAGVTNNLHGGAGDDRYVLEVEDMIFEGAGGGVDTVETRTLARYTLQGEVENLIYLGAEAFVGTGNEAANSIEGGSSGDSLRGEAGNDHLMGGPGNDLLDGGSGLDTAVYAGQRSAYLIQAIGGLTTVSGPDGTDTLQNIERLRFSDGLFDLSGAPVFDSTPNADRLEGSAADDLIEGLGGDDILFGNGGADVLRGGLGSDTLSGGDESDTADYTMAASGVVASLLTATGSSDGDGGSDTFISIENLIGSAFSDTLIGDTDGNQLVGLAGNDTLSGDGGDDILVGGAGADVLNGGAGIDTVDYSAAAAGMRAQLNTSASTNDGDGGTDTFSSIENLTGSAFSDVLIGDANANALRGGLGADTLLGLAGNDVIWGGSGAANTLQGGLGDDRYVLEANDSVYEAAGEGVDTIEARINAYVLAANVENLVFGGTGNFAATGNAQANTITGGLGDDNLRGRGGSDVLNGGAGIDTVDYTLAASAVTARLDRMQATNDGDGATDTFSGVENLIGSNFNDLLIGDAGNNVLNGGVGVDVLLGFAGDDILWGGPAGGNNQLQGGVGNDYYVLEAFDTVVEFAGEGVDTVEARIASYTMRANVENLIYTGASSTFVGAGNTLDNHMTGGAGNDILRGMGGDDTLVGGLGKDEVQMRGLAGEYTVTAEGSGWRITDSVAGRDGSTFVESIEVIRWSNNQVRLLSYPPVAAAPGEPTSKGGPEVSPLLADDLFGKDGDAFVLPALGDDLAQILPGLADGKDGLAYEVLPALADRLFAGLELHLAHYEGGMLTLDHEGAFVVRNGHDWSI